MTFNEYQAGTESTWRTDQVIPADKAELVAAVIGLPGEVGEVCDMVKKDLFHGVPMDPDKMLKELGDVLYYLARTADYYDFTLEEVARVNNIKLAKRYPKGFVEGGGIRNGD